jgi:hypothetical protein
MNYERKSDERPVRRSPRETSGAESEERKQKVRSLSKATVSDALSFGMVVLEHPTDEPALTHSTVKIEHFALNVDDPVAMAEWYIAHVGLTLARRIEGPPHTHFLADDSGTVMLEIYNNPPDAVPDYAGMNPLLVHLAFVSSDPARDAALLMEAGATLADDVHMDDGSHLVMLRDPWGLAIQLCKRGVPMLRGERKNGRTEEREN